MDCREFEQHILALAGNQLMDASVRQRASRHAAECSPCAGRLLDERILAAGLYAYAKNTEMEAAPAHIKQTLRAVFDEQTKAKAVVIPMPTREWRWHHMALAAAAALVLFALVATLWLRNQGHKQQEIFVLSSPTPGVTPNPISPQLATPIPVFVQKTEKKIERKFPHIAPGRSQRIELAQTNANEVATGYIPLTYSTARNAVQDGLVVRMAVARSTLISMGLPLNAERANERVKADVVMSVDGVPLAIRLVQ